MGYNISNPYPGSSVSPWHQVFAPISSSQHPPPPQRPLEQAFDALLRAALGCRSKRSNRRSPVRSQTLLRLRALALAADTWWTVLWLVESGRERSQDRIGADFGLRLREFIVRAGRVCRVWRGRRFLWLFCWLLGNGKVLHAF